ncbi:hypothetical protein GO613_14545 [Azoarcus communis]|uniref:TnsA endonuclease N-terminal domain-containing protein n=1 Tax=Parazoarcus communis TaxID=41977 RepID=UPI0014592EC5|nr:TnsA endonuclease N-terminal domain-containing protein [Parazoarcus communis]NMG49314.1 hypothetical protein [Parazoarcus communis]
MNTPKRRTKAPKHTVQGARILGRISGRPAVFYDSRKAGGILALESASERVIAQLAELDPRVKSISPQPFALDVITGKVFKTRAELEDDRKSRQSVDSLRRDYTPDLLLVLHDDTRIIVEAKDARHLPQGEYLKKLDTARRIFAMRGERFVLIPLKYDERAPIVYNAERLALALTQPLAPNVIHDASCKVSTLLANEQIPLGDLMPQLELDLRMAPSLIVTGVLEADICSGPINRKTLVRAAYGSLSHLEILTLEEVKP